MKGKPKMYLEKTLVEIWTNNRNHKNPKKKLKQTKLGTLTFEGYANMGNLSRVLDAIEENMYQQDAVEFRIKLTANNW